MSKKQGNKWRKKWFEDGYAAYKAGYLPSCCPRQPMGGGTAYHLWMDGYNAAKNEARPEIKSARKQRNKP